MEENEPENEHALSSVQMLRSELAQEIISRKAGFLEKWSLLVFLGILLLVLGGTWFVHYPEVISAQAILTAENNPKELMVRQEGRLIKLFVKNKQFIKANNDIAWIESTASHQEVNELLKEINESIAFFETGNPQKIAASFNTNFNNLGELQVDYQQFLIAEIDFNKYLSNLSNLNTVKSAHKVDRVKIAFQQQLQFLKNKVIAWINRFELKAPFDGEISLTENIKQGDYLKSATLLGYILPINNNYFMETIIPQSSFGKIDTGLRVQLRLDAYPYEEWGFVNGTINYISNMPSGPGFMATIRLDNGAITNNQKKIILRSGLRAQAIIITKDIRLLQKFYYGFIKSTSVNK